MISVNNKNPEEMAKMLLTEYWDYSLPINPIMFANKLGIKVYKQNSTTDTGSGNYDHENKKIYVNINEPSVRQRFTVAHELGHALLHKKSCDRTGIKYDLGNYQIEEVEANRFAAELLIPREALQTFLPMGLSFNQLCAKFDVSGEAMNIRLKRLGLYL